MTQMVKENKVQECFVENVENWDEECKADLKLGEEIEVNTALENLLYEMDKLDAYFDLMHEKGNESEKQLYEEISRFRAAYHEHKAVIEDAYAESERRVSIALDNDN